MAALTSKMENGGRSMQQEIASIDALNLVLDRFVERVESLGGANGALSQASTGMLAVSKSAAASNVAIRKSVDGLSEVANRVANAGNVIAQMQEISKTASMQLASLASASERIAGALAAIESSTVATDTLQSCIAKLSSAFQPLSVRADMLTGQLEKAGHVSERLENQFSGLPRYAALLKDTEQGMSQSLRQITHSLSTAATQAQQLSLNTENSAKALESANKLLSSAENLQEAVSALRQLFGDLTKSIAATQTLLSDSSRGFKEAISHSVLAIDSASKRISGAGNLTSARSASSDDVLPSAYGFGGRRRDENV
jgi:chromosome segregation ATPase